MTTTWSFGGTTLSTYGKVTLINDYLDVPPRRGDNITIPYAHGQVFVKKYYDARKLTFGIAVNAASGTALESTIDTLKAKLALNTQQTLSHTMADSTVRTISATVDELLEPDRITNSVAKYVITFKCVSPYFRLSTAISDNTTTINANPKAMTVANPGTAVENAPTITLTGPLQNTVITNSTTGYVLTYTGTIASPRVVTLSVDSTTGEWVATDDLGANKINLFSHSGGAEYMIFNPGNNTLSIADDTHTTGTVKAGFYAPFL